MISLPEEFVQKNYFSENSMARNAEFSAKVIQKLTEQRTTSDLKANDVKKILDEKMTGEMVCTAEQVELIKSIINQAISEERKINEGLTNVMLKSLLTSIDAESAKSLESHTEMLDMVSVFYLLSNHLITIRFNIFFITFR